MVVGFFGYRTTAEDIYISLPLSVKRKIYSYTLELLGHRSRSTGSGLPLPASLCQYIIFGLKILHTTPTTPTRLTGSMKLFANFIGLAIVVSLALVDCAPLLKRAPSGPVITSDFPDPSIVHIGDIWYAFGTQVNRFSYRTPSAPHSGC